MPLCRTLHATGDHQFRLGDANRSPTNVTKRSTRLAVQDMNDQLLSFCIGRNVSLC
jgi:hypothetical protein